MESKRKTSGGRGKTSKLVSFLNNKANAITKGRSKTSKLVSFLNNKKNRVTKGKGKKSRIKNMKKKFLSLLAIPIVALSIANCSPQHQQMKVERIPKSTEEYIGASQIQSINRGQTTEKLRAPQYKRYKRKGAWCAGYSVLTSRDKFNKDIFYADWAWNLKYNKNNEVVAQVSGNKELRQLFENGTLKKGMIVTFHNPYSGYNNKIDKKRKPVTYKHAATYAGTEDNEPMFYHQYKNRMEKMSLKNLKNSYNLSARDVIDERTTKKAISKRKPKKNNHKYHTVKKGDTFWSIARKNELSRQQLEKYNPRTTPDRIYPHQKIRIR